MDQKLFRFICGYRTGFDPQYFLSYDRKMKKSREMFNLSIKMNNRLIRIHERALRIVYEDHSSTTYDELLKKKGSEKSIHHRNVQLVAVERWKCSRLNIISVLN